MVAGGYPWVQGRSQAVGMAVVGLLGEGSSPSGEAPTKVDPEGPDG